MSQQDIDQQRFKDLVTFGRHLTSTKDIDPVYPLLKWVIRNRGLDDEEAHWLVYIYLCAYNTATAWQIFLEFPQPHFYSSGVVEDFRKWEVERRKTLPINIERRGLRGGKIVEALESYSCLTAGSTQRHWLMASTGGRFDRLWDYLQGVKFVGRWATFKWLDLLKHVLDYSIEFPDMRLAFCSGPRQALEELYLGARSDRQDDSYITYLDLLGNNLKARLGEVGLSLTYDELETVLCNFHSTMHGRYYVGHDIDEHQENLEAGLGVSGDSVIWWDARNHVLDRRLLGEYNGWRGVRKDLLRLYKDRGEIYTGRPHGKAADLGR